MFHQSAILCTFTHLFKSHLFKLKRCVKAHKIALWLNIFIVLKVKFSVTCIMLYLLLMSPVGLEWKKHVYFCRAQVQRLSLRSGVWDEVWIHVPSLAAAVRKIRFHYRLRGNHVRTLLNDFGGWNSLADFHFRFLLAENTVNSARVIP